MKPLDPIAFLVAQLLGEPLPAFAPIPGRLHVAPRITDADPGLVEPEHAQVWRALAADTEGGTND